MRRGGGGVAICTSMASRRPESRARRARLRASLPGEWYPVTQKRLSLARHWGGGGGSGGAGTARGVTGGGGGGRGGATVRRVRRQESATLSPAVPRMRWDRRMQLGVSQV